MSFFVKPTPAPTPKSSQVKQISILFAVLLVIMAVAQLFTYEEFIPLVATFNLPVGETLSYLVVPLLIVCEVFALPFLLRMSLSPAFRFVSMVSGWFVAIIWFLMTLWIVSTSQAVETIGFVGTVATLIPGWWAVLFSVALGILAAWASWGMWPIKTKKK